MTNKKLFIFDMDGTLIDSSNTIANSINFVRENLELEPLPNSDIISKINDHSINPAHYFYEKDEFEPIHEKWFSSYYSKNHKKDIRLYDGIYNMLKALKASGALIALATNAYRVSAIESIEYLGISRFFDTIACADDVKRGKPYPDMLYKVLLDLDVKNTEAIFIGDGPRDEDASEAAYINYIMVDWGFTEHSKDLKVISDARDLENMLLGYL